jgi:SAM-dependent methyltransferase
MFHPEGPSVRELLVQGLSSLERGYDLLAPKFDVTPFRTPDAVLGPVAARLAAGPPVAAALDLACGTGAAMVHLKPLVRERLTGVDLSAGMLARARENLARVPGGPPRVELVRGDARALDYEAQFDLVTSFGAFGHIPPEDEGALLAGVARALRPGGRFVFVTAPPPPLLSAGRWLAHGFNAAMHVRNALWRPRFVMTYLTFLLPRARAACEAAGLSVRVEEGLFPAPWARLVLVTATRA